MTDKRIEILENFRADWTDNDNKPFYNEDQVLKAMNRFAEMAFNAGKIMGVDVDHGFPCTYLNFKDWLKQQTEGGSNE